MHKSGGPKVSTLFSPSCCHKVKLDDDPKPKLIECGKCYKSFHATCLKLSSEEFSSIELWFCSDCLTKHSDLKIIHKAGLFTIFGALGYQVSFLKIFFLREKSGDAEGVVVKTLALHSLLERQ